MLLAVAVREPRREVTSLGDYPLDHPSHRRVSTDHDHHGRDGQIRVPPPLEGRLPLAAELLKGASYLGDVIGDVPARRHVVLKRLERLLLLALDVLPQVPVLRRRAPRVVVGRDSGHLHESGLDRIDKSEVGHDPLERPKRLLGADRTWIHRRRRVVDAAQYAAVAIDPREALDPHGRLLELGLLIALDREIRRRPPRMVGLVVQDHDPPLAAEVAQHPAAIGRVAFLPKLQNGAFRILLLGERMPVDDHHPDLAEQAREVAGD